MNRFQDDDDAWNLCNENDLWIFDKLILSRKLKYKCGPIGSWVPKPNWYIVRPCVNTEGLGRGATIEWIDKKTEHLSTGYFWCELFKGRHISVDYTDQLQELTVEGFRLLGDPIYKFCRWKRVKDIIPFPDIFKDLPYKYINIEYIDNNIIEIHLRHNPEFLDTDTELIPVWSKDQICPNGYKFRKLADYKRFGHFYR